MYPFNLILQITLIFFLLSYKECFVQISTYIFWLNANTYWSIIYFFLLFFVCDALIITNIRVCSIQYVNIIFFVMCIQWWSSYLLLQRKFACNLIVIVVLTVLNEIKRWQSTSLVETAWYFSIKKSPCFTAHRYYHLHRRVINRSSNRRDFCLYALFLTSRTHKRIEHSSLLSLPLIFPSVKHSSHI